MQVLKAIFISALVTLAAGTHEKAQHILSNLEEGKGRVPNCKANDEDILSCQMGTLNIEALKSGVDLIFPNGEAFARDNEPVNTGDGNFTSYKYQGKGDNQAVLTFSTQGDFFLDGEVTFNGGKVYAIDTCIKKSEELDDRSILDADHPENCGVWIHENEDNYKSVEVEGEDNIGPQGRSMPAETLEELEKWNSLNRQSSTTISILFYYTPELYNRFRSLSGVYGYINQQVAETNTILRNSQIPLNIRVLCVERAPISESVGGRSYLAAMEDAMTSNYKAMAASADMTGIMTNGASEGLCGQARKLNIVYPSWTFGANVFWSGYRCNIFTLAHEIGHLLGGWHDRATLTRQCGTCAPRFNFEYGYNDPVAKAGTVMAYRPPGYSHRPYFSTPSISVAGRPIGASNADVRRIIFNTMGLISRIGDERQACCVRNVQSFPGCVNGRGNNNCLFWREQGFCRSSVYGAFMRTNCALACGYCGQACQDLSNNCNQFASLCNSASMRGFARTTCPRTCGLCAA